MSVPRQIKVQDKTYDDLKDLGKKGDTFDEIIQRCILAYKKANKQ